jgi:hypothetical protein
MKKGFYLIVSRNGSMRVNKSIPRLDWDEISIYTTLEIPDQLFNRPALQAAITIPESAVNKNPLTAEVVDNVKEAIESTTGLKFSVTVEEPPKEE